MKKTVLTKWEADGNLAVIYRVENVLLFYAKNNDPNFRKNQEVALDEVQNSKPYKAIPFHMDNVPNDASVSIAFAWSE